MKKARLILLFAVAGLFAIGCSKDDDKDGADGAQGTAPDGVPTGVIVPVDQRNEVLTGFDIVNGEAKGVQNESQKWWEYKLGEILSDDCPEYAQTLQNDYYIAWTPDGRIVYKYEIGGEIIDQGKTWEWHDGKDAILLNGQTVFKLSSLNDDTGVVYHSTQGQGGCNVTTYEHVDNFHYE